MYYLDFDLHIGHRQGNAYPVTVLYSPAGEGRAMLHLPFEAAPMIQAVAAGLRDVLPRAARANNTAVQTTGSALFRALMTGQVEHVYRTSLALARQQGKGLCLRLRLEPSELTLYPWEYLYDEEEGDYLSLSQQTSLIRYLELPRPPASLPIQAPLRILAMVATPEDTQPLQASHEKVVMERALGDLIQKGQVELHWVEGQTWKALQGTLWEGPWHIFHFIGHGLFDNKTQEGQLVLSDQHGAALKVGGMELTRLLKDVHAVRLVVLNACQGAQSSTTDSYSSIAATLVRGGLPAVVAMQHPITDRAAIAFADVFYCALAHSLPINAAVAEARKAMAQGRRGMLEWGTPALFMRAPQGLLFSINEKLASPGDALATPSPTPAMNTMELDLGEVEGDVDLINNDTKGKAEANCKEPPNYMKMKATRVKGGKITIANRRKQ